MKKKVFEMANSAVSNNNPNLDYEGVTDGSPIMGAFLTSLTPQIKPALVSEEMVMDYVTLRGIENKLSLKKEDIPVYILHELLDNGLDYIETTLSRELTPEIKVHISTDDKAIHLKVSNPDTSQTFTTEMIKDMFNYYNYSSTKRNQFKISRGALGHGLKSVLSSAYALGTEYYNHSSWTPIKIKNRNKEFTVSLTVDRNTGLQPPDVKSTIVDYIPNTQIEIDIPVDKDSIDHQLILLESCFNTTVILNPHIDMSISLSNGYDHIYRHVQEHKTDWRNLHSIWSYSEKDFEYLISTIRGKGTLYDAIISIGLSEAYALRKRPEFCTPLADARHDKSLIHTLYLALKKISGPKDRIDLPYDMRIKPRKDAIKKRLEQLGMNVLNIKYNSVNWLYQSEDKEVQFPYLFEVAEIRTEDNENTIMSGINSSASKLQLIQDSDAFTYTKQTWTYHANSIIGLLYTECGYSFDPKKNKKPGSFVFMNFISPRIDYKSYAKSDIDLKLFGNTIAQSVYDTCKGGKRAPRIKGKKTQAEIRINFLTDRYNSVKQNPKLIIEDRWTPSDIWYGCRPTLLENGIIIGPNTRSNFTAAIRDDCETEFNCNMEELGIFAADRAQLYFDGHWYDVGFDDLHALKLKGTDLIIIEKEGMAETLTAVADKYGWALLFTRGFATKYVRDLSELCKKYNGNVCVLSDYDASGILLASKLKVPRIGIDGDTLEYFKLKREQVQEEYDPRNHLAGIKALVSHKEFEYLEHKRIEINSVKTKVGTQAFQDWIIYRIVELNPTRDYRRAIKLEAVLPDDLKKQFDSITTIIKGYQKNRCDEITDALTDVEGLLDVPNERITIDLDLKKVITDNPDYQEFIQKYNELMSHPFITKAPENEEI